MPPAAAPTRPGAVVAVGIVAALAVLAVAAVLIREALVIWGVLDAPAWIPQALDGIEGTAPSTALSVLAGVAVLLGIWLVVVALGRRVHTRLPVQSDAGAWIGRADVARLATRAAIDVDGVVAARSRVRRKRVDVTVHTPGPSQDVVAAVQRSVEHLLLPLPGITVKVSGRRA